MKNARCSPENELWPPYEILFQAFITVSFFAPTCAQRTSGEIRLTHAMNAHVLRALRLRYGDAGPTLIASL